MPMLHRLSPDHDFFRSVSIGLGMAGTVERYVRGTNGTLLKGYRTAFYFETGLATLAVLVVALFVRVPKQAQYRE